jgi:uncharacterized protein (TIGR02117 family)
MKNFLLFLIFIPLFLLYLIVCFLFPIIKFGKIKKEKGSKIYICKDPIHSDYVFRTKDVLDMFLTKKNYVKIGWGDRKIFLETQSWNKVKIQDIIGAFFGLNKTVLRVEFLDNIPEKSIEINLSKEQLEIIKNHIGNSYNKKLIKKKKEYYQIGDFYESDLKYSCINTCNNWVNQGLKKAKITNRIWCPLSFWI